jgi:ribosomal protein S18 acetylase RimI-like enzyme
MKVLPRPARRDDHPRYQQLQRQLGTDQPPFEIDWWDDHYRAHTTFFEADTGELVAYALTVPLGARGDVRQIVVDSAWRGRGIGKQMMTVVAGQLREAGCRDWHLEVRANNEPAIALYRSVGMQVLHDIYVLRIARGAAERFAGTARAPSAVELVDAGDDAILERAFDLGAGQLARWRTARPSAVMWKIGDRALTHYMASFLPDCGLLFPFRAPDPEHAAQLFAAAVAHGMSSSVEVCVVDLAVRDALLAAGATEYEHQLELGGPLS